MHGSADAIRHNEHWTMIHSKAKGRGKFYALSHPLLQEKGAFIIRDERRGGSLLSSLKERKEREGSRRSLRLVKNHRRNEEVKRKEAKNKKTGGLTPPLTP